MRLARSLALLVVLGSLATLLAACAAAPTPGWTFSPTPTPTVAPSQAPDASSAPATPATPAPSGAPSAAPSDGGSGAVVQLTLTASGIAFDTDSLEVPADTPFQIVFANNDAGIPHNVAIHKDSPTGELVWSGDIFNGVETRTYDVPALPAGTYGFVCVVHPNMTGTLTAK